MSKEKITVLLGRKVGMTQIYDKNRVLLPITVIEAGPCPVVQVKTESKEGYDSVQIGFSSQKESRLTKAELNHLKKAELGALSYLKEFRVDSLDGYSAGLVLDVSRFSEGDLADIVGTVKGRGFQGVVKRWGFAGGPASHGSMSHRRGGSFGMRQDPGKVYKGRKMPGHMGQNRCTMQNLDIVKVLPEENLILVKGSIPGSKGSLVLVRSAKKAK